MQKMSDLTSIKRNLSDAFGCTSSPAAMSGGDRSRGDRLSTNTTDDSEFETFSPEEVQEYYRKWRVNVATKPPGLRVYYRDSPHLHPLVRDKRVRTARGLLVDISASFDGQLVDTVLVDWRCELLYEDYCPVVTKEEPIVVQSKYYDVDKRTWTYLLQIREISSKHQKRRFRVKIYSDSFKGDDPTARCVGSYLGPITVKTKRSKEDKRILPEEYCQASDIPTNTPQIHFAPQNRSPLANVPRPRPLRGFGPAAPPFGHNNQSKSTKNNARHQSPRMSNDLSGMLSQGFLPTASLHGSRAALSTSNAFSPVVRGSTGSSNTSAPSQGTKNTGNINATSATLTGAYSTIASHTVPYSAVSDSTVNPQTNGHGVLQSYVAHGTCENKAAPHSESSSTSSTMANTDFSSLSSGRSSASTLSRCSPSTSSAGIKASSNREAEGTSSTDNHQNTGPQLPAAHPLSQTSAEAAASSSSAASAAVAAALAASTALATATAVAAAAVPPPHVLAGLVSSINGDTDGLNEDLRFKQMSRIEAQLRKNCEVLHALKNSLSQSYATFHHATRDPAAAAEVFGYHGQGYGFCSPTTCRAYDSQHAFPHHLNSTPTANHTPHRHYTPPQPQRGPTCGPPATPNTRCSHTPSNQTSGFSTPHGPLVGNLTNPAASTNTIGNSTNGKNDSNLSHASSPAVFSPMRITRSASRAAQASQNTNPDSTCQHNTTRANERFSHARSNVSRNMNASTGATQFAVSTRHHAYPKPHAQPLHHATRPQNGDTYDTVGCQDGTSTSNNALAPNLGNNNAAARSVNRNMGNSARAAHTSAGSTSTSGNNPHTAAVSAAGCNNSAHTVNGHAANNGVGGGNSTSQMAPTTPSPAPCSPSPRRAAGVLPPPHPSPPTLYSLMAIDTN